MKRFNTMKLSLNFLLMLLMVTSIACSKDNENDNDNNSGPGPIPVAYYTFDGNANDMSGGFNGVLYGTPSFTPDRNGNPSSSLKLDGVDDFVELGNLDLGSSFTIGFWINPATTDNGQAFIALNTYDYGSHLENGLLFGHWGDGLHVRITTSSHSESEKLTGWQHLILTVKESVSTSTVEVYRNGTLSWSQTFSTIVPTTNLKPWLIGMEYDGDNETNFFNGEIDEVRFFDFVLTAKEISDLYSSK